LVAAIKTTLTFECTQQPFNVECAYDSITQRWFSATTDSAAASNVRLLRELTTPTVVVEVPFLGVAMGGVEGLSRKCKKIKKTLAAISDFDTFRPLLKSSDFKTGRKNC